MDFRPPPLPVLALNKEIQGLTGKKEGSSLEKGATKTLPGCYSGGTALGKQISTQSEKRRQGGEAAGVSEPSNIKYSAAKGG